MGTFEVDMFGEDVDGPYHPEAVKLHDLLEQVADEYSCELLLFQVDKGTVSFSFDNDELSARILKLLKEPEAEEQ